MKHFSLITEEQLVMGVWKCVEQQALSESLTGEHSEVGSRYFLLDHLHGINPTEEPGCLADLSLHTLSLKCRSQENLLACPFTPEVPTFLNTHVCIHWVPCMPERVLLDMLYLAWPVLDEQTHTPHLSPADENGHTFTFSPRLGSWGGRSGLDVLLSLGTLQLFSHNGACVFWKRCLSIHLFFFLTVTFSLA